MKFLILQIVSILTMCDSSGIDILCLQIFTFVNLLTSIIVTVSGDANMIVPQCKLHNDSSVDISQDGRLLTTFVHTHRGFPDDYILAVYSLNPESLGQCLYTKSFGMTLPTFRCTFKCC